MQQQLELHLDAARTRARVGIERAADATEAENPGWCEMACERLRVFAHQHDGPFTIELARGSFEKQIPAPHDLRSWGQVTRMATSREYIEKVKGLYHPAASSNGSDKPVYRRGPKA